MRKVRRPPTTTVPEYRSRTISETGATLVPRSGTPAKAALPPIQSHLQIPLAGSHQLAIIPPLISRVTKTTPRPDSFARNPNSAGCRPAGGALAWLAGPAALRAPGCHAAAGKPLLETR